LTYRIELDESERRAERLANDFGPALEEGQLYLAYQPIVDTDTGSVVGVEALIRWAHPELGPVGAPAILETAEATGNVDKLNAWIFETALIDTASCGSNNGFELFIAVNVSPQELELDSLVDNMVVALAASGVAPSRVIVELSERIVAKARGSISNINRLIALGLELALDDFGQGQTSLAHLRGLPISFLKLDRLFIQHASESTEDRKVLGSVVGLAHDLGFSVIAEGIETPDQREIVSLAGADLAQGYGLHRPMPIADLRKLLGAAAALDAAPQLAVGPAGFATAKSAIDNANFAPLSPDSERVG
jgi:EAL domain-containing protein (putative c-di-GMP-specific phosphodiesterase class I)